jgi:hypothetical protein
LKAKELHLSDVDFATVFGMSRVRVGGGVVASVAAAEQCR